MTKILFFDLETTGIHPHKHGIHQISALLDIDGEIVEQVNYNVRPNPKCTIDPVALEIGHVTHKQIMAYPPMEEVHKQINEFLGKYINKFDRHDKAFLCGYNNAPFDNNFFRGFFLQNDDKFFGSWFWSNSLDVMVLATQYTIKNRFTFQDFKLATVAKELGIKVIDERLHDATYDLKLTREIYYKVVENG